MKKIGIYFGSTTGTTEAVAQKIASLLSVASQDVHNVADADASTAANYDLLILGSSTWGDGEMQDDWYDFVQALKPHVAGKEVAFFGLGEEDSYDSTYCDAIGLIYDELQGCNCTFVGSFPKDGYNYSASKAERDGKLIGVCLDEVSYEDLTDERLNKWISTLK